MATGGGGGSLYRHGGVADDGAGDGGAADGGAADGGAADGGGRRRFDRVGIDLDSGGELEAMEVPAAGGQKSAVEEGSSQVDALSHYLPDYRQHSEIWQLLIQFDGAKFVSTSMRRADIRFLSLLELMEKEGYGLCDSMYYVKDEGEGLKGLDIVDSNAKVEHMLTKYEKTKKLVLTVMRDKSKQAIVLSPVKTKQRKEKLNGRNFPRHSVVDLEEEEWQNNYYQTQNSVNFEPLQTFKEAVAHQGEDTGEGEDAEEGEDAGEGFVSDDDSWLYPCQYDAVEAEKQRKKEEEDIKERIARRKRKYNPDEQLCEDSSEAEEIFDSYVPASKKVKQGPTQRSHSHAALPVRTEWAPSDDEEDLGFLNPEEDDGFEPLNFVLPNGRKSRAKRQTKRVWYDETRENPEQHFCVKLCFKDVYQFRQALCRLHIVQVRNFHYHRNCSDRIIVCCKPVKKKKKKKGTEEESDEEVPAKQKCQFFMSASKIKNESTFCIKKMHLQHTCPTQPQSTRVNSKWLSQTYVDEFRSEPNTGIRTIVDKAQKDFGVSVAKRMAYRVKTKARQTVMGDHKKQYHRIRDYLQTVIDKNPGSRCIVTTEFGPTDEQKEAMKKGKQVFICDKPRFHGLFFCVNAARLGFLEGCRPFIGLDGCFIKLTTGAQILAATGRDGNNNIYPIAWAIVAKEDTENWQWFLEQLKEALGGEDGQFGQYTIMFDRQKGLIKAVTTVFPNCHQRFCLRHIYANFQTAGFRGEDLKKCIDSAAYSYTKDGFDKAMDELKKQCELAWQWLCKIPVHTWARWAFDTNCKTYLVNNNLSEVFNRYILDERNKPIVTMLVGIYDKQMARFDEKREGLRESSWEITPEYGEKLEVMKKFARYCVPLRADVGLWQVSSGDHTYEVNLAQRTCSCRKWDLSGLPCNHAVSAIYKSGEYPEDYVSHFYKRDMYHKSYMPVFYPMPQQHAWTKTDTEDIMPPAFKDHLKGRRQEKRRKGKHEVPKPKETSRMATITCSNCKLQGHKYTSCVQPLRPDLAFRKSQHKTTRRNPYEAGAGAGTSGAGAGTSGAGPSTYDAGPSASASTSPRRGVMSYFTAGANAGPGRDPNVAPLDG